MNRISIKLGILFFIVVITLESIFSIYLFFSLQDSRIQEEMEELRARGNSHRNVLEKHNNEETLFHVALMESEAETDVVITDMFGKILAASEKEGKYDEYIEDAIRLGNIPRNGLIVEGDWRKRKYIATVSPLIQAKEQVSLVFMFKGTESIHEMTKSLRNHFQTIGAVTILLTIVSIFIFTRSITYPLIRMKQATERLSQGDFTVSLNVSTNDELSELAHSIEKLATDLNRLQKERNEFLASIAHELRTPLTYINGYADVASRSSISDKDRDQYLAIIKEEITNLAKLIHTLFELAKVDQHSFQVCKQKVNLHTFLEKIVRKVTPTYLQKQIVIKLDGDSAIQVELDAERFEQVFTNLLDNSLKYSDEQTQVTISFENDKHHVIIKIMDEGIGIPESDVPYIFERLYRVDKSRSRSSGGTGLGLSIAKEIVEAHGGMIWVESTLNAGTIITIRLDRCI
ncbi:sensor histidine kinase [Bacillus sp. DJP31]|uniref:sensor histidine kinase n=1 Tax=Bacillus sp. DJP31 TaxID=3409789 RepID=UPI003BB653BA